MTSRKAEAKPKAKANANANANAGVLRCAQNDTRRQRHSKKQKANTKILRLAQNDDAKKGSSIGSARWAISARLFAFRFAGVRGVLYTF